MMAVDEEPYTSVFESVSSAGDRIRILCRQNSNGTVSTKLEILREGRAPFHAGFGGPALGVDRLVNVWAGGADDLPAFVMVRAASQIVRAEVDRVTGGDRVPLALTATVEQFGLRFGLCEVQVTHEPLVLRAYDGDGRQVVDIAVRTPWIRER